MFGSNVFIQIVLRLTGIYIEFIWTWNWLFMSRNLNFVNWKVKWFQNLSCSFRIQKYNLETQECHHVNMWILFSDMLPIPWWLEIFYEISFRSFWSSLRVLLIFLVRLFCKLVPCALFPCLVVRSSSKDWACFEACLMLLRRTLFTW